MQPLADNLDATTYSVFEEDTIKYNKYREAIGLAISDLVELVKDSRDIIIFLLGAGRGPLVSIFIKIL